MSTKEKLLKRFKSKPTDFTWDELTRLLKYLGYTQASAGKTGGSRTKFIHLHCPPIMLHRPHPGSILKRYQIEYIYDTLESEKLL